MKIRISETHFNGEVNEMTNELFKQFKKETKTLIKLADEISKKYKAYVAVSAFPQDEGFDNHIWAWHNKEVEK